LLKTKKKKREREESFDRFPKSLRGEILREEEKNKLRGDEAMRVKSMVNTTADDVK